MELKCRKSRQQISPRFPIQYWKMAREEFNDSILGSKLLESIPECFELKYVIYLEVTAARVNPRCANAYTCLGQRLERW